MKKVVGILFAILPSVLFAQGKFTINGKLGTNTIADKVYIIYRVNGKPVLDSADIQNGQFHFNGSVKEPTLARIAIFKPAYKGYLISFKNFAENAVTDFAATDLNDMAFRTILSTFVDLRQFYLGKGNIDINGADLKTAAINGSGHNKQLNGEYNGYLATVVPLEQATMAASLSTTPGKSKEFYKEKDDIVNQKMYEKHMAQLKFIKTHPDSYASLDLLNYYIAWGPMTQADSAQQLLDRFSAKLRNSYEGKQDVLRIAEARKFGVGTVAPDFALNDLNGKPVKLSDFRGKYVLIDFWFQACHPCRAEMPYMKAAFEKFKNKDFVVIGINTDKKRENMLTALGQDGTDIWINLPYSKETDQALQDYKVMEHGFPSSFLIGPDGKFVAKDLHGKQFDEELSGIYKQITK